MKKKGEDSKSKQKALFDKIKLKQKLQNIETIQIKYEETCQEQQQTKKNYLEFRKKVKNLNIEKIMNNEKSLYIGSEADALLGYRNSFNPIESIDKTVLAEMKKYKNCNPEDVNILKSLKLKISNYLLSAEEEAGAAFQYKQRFTSDDKIYTYLEEQNQISEINIQGSSYLYDANRNFIDQQQFINKMKIEFVSLTSQIQVQKQIIYQINFKLEEYYGQREISKNTLGDAATDFDDIDEENKVKIKSLPLEMEQVYEEIQDYLKNGPKDRDVKSHIEEFDIKQKIYNHRLIKEKRELSIQSLNKISEQINSITLGFTTFAGSESSENESGSIEEVSGIQQLQQTLDQMQEKMQNISNQNNKNIQDESLNLNTSLLNISKEIDFKSTQNLKIKTEDNSIQIQQQTEAFKQVVEKLRNQIKIMENSKQGNRPCEISNLKTIVVQEGTQTENKVEERETQTIVHRQLEKQVQVNSEMRQNCNQTIIVKKNDMRCQTKEFFGVLIDPVHMQTQATIQVQIQSKESQTDDSSQVFQSQNNLSNIEIAPQYLHEMRSQMTQIIDQVYTANKKVIDIKISENKFKPTKTLSRQGLTSTQKSTVSKAQIQKTQNYNKHIQTEHDYSELDNKLQYRHKLQEVISQKKELSVRENDLFFKQSELQQIETRNIKQNQELSILSQQIKEKQQFIFKQFKDQSTQKAQIEHERLHNIELKKFLQQKEEDQNFIETELENERLQLEEEYKELLSKMEFVKENEKGVERDQQKMSKAKGKLKMERSKLYAKEKELLVRQKEFKDEQNRQKTYMFELRMQDHHISKLERCLDLFFEQLQPEIDGAMGEADEETNTLFEKERDDIMVKRYQLEEFKKELECIQQRIAQQKAVEHEDFVVSDNAIRSEISDEERLTYMRYREAKSIDAINRRRDQLEMIDLNLKKQIEMDQKKKNERKLQANVQPTMLPRFSARSADKNPPRQSLAARLSAARGCSRPSQRPSQRLSQHLTAARPSQRDSNRQSTPLWRKSTMEQIDDVPESLEDQVFMNLKSNVLVQEIPEYPNDEDEDQDFYLERKTDQVAKEISFNVLTQSAYPSSNQDQGSDDDSSDSSSQDEVKQPQLESPLTSPKPGGQIVIEAQEDDEDCSSVKANQGVKYNWLMAATKPEDIPAGIEMSVTPDKDESHMDMRDSNNLLGSPNLLGGMTPEISPSANQMERETTERISDIGLNMKNLFGNMGEKTESLRWSKGKESVDSQISFANEKSFAAAATKYEHKKIDKFNKNFTRDTKVDLDKVNEQPKEVYIESGEDDSDKSDDEEKNEIQDILEKSQVDLNTQYNEILENSPDKGGYEEEPFRVADPSKQKHISRINRAHLNKSSFAPSSAPMTEADISKMELLGDILNQQDDMASVSVMLAESFDDADETGARDSMTSAMTVFTPQQLQDFERIGLSGELFREVRQYYKQLGKTKEQMMEDLLTYQQKLEDEIQSNIQIEKKKKEKKPKKDKADKADKSAKKDKKKKERKSRKSGSRKSDMSPSKSKTGTSKTAKSTRQRSSKRQRDNESGGVYDYEGPLRETQKNEGPMSPFAASRLQNLISEPISQQSIQKVKKIVAQNNPRFSKRSLNFDQDSIEESVFIEKFQIQDRGEDQMKRTLRDGEVSMVNTTQMDQTQVRDSHNPMCFAGEELSIEVVEEEEITKPHQNMIQDQYKESLINQIASPESNLFRNNHYKESLINQIGANSQNENTNMFNSQKQNLYKESQKEQIQSFELDNNIFNQNKKPMQMQIKLFAVKEEQPNNNECIQYDENFRQTEDSLLKGKNQEQVRNYFKYPSQNNALPEVFKQKPFNDNQPRNSRDFFNNLKKQRKSKQSIRTSQNNDFGENFRETERMSDNSRKQGINTGIINYEEVQKQETSPENRQSFYQSFETSGAQPVDPKNSVLNFGNLIYNFQN